MTQGLDPASIPIHLPGVQTFGFFLATIWNPPHLEDRHTLGRHVCTDVPRCGLLGHWADDANVHNTPVLWLGRTSHGGRANAQIWSRQRPHSRHAALESLSIAALSDIAKSKFQEQYLPPTFMKGWLRRLANYQACSWTWHCCYRLLL